MPVFSSNNIFHSFADAVIFLPAIICAFMLAVLIFRRRNLSRSQVLLIPVLGCSWFFYTCCPAYLHDYAGTLSKIFIADSIITLSLYGTIFNFLRSLITDDHIRRRDYLWFLGPFVIGAAYVFFGAIIPFDEMESLAYSFFSNQDISIYFTDIRFAFFIVIVLYGYYFVAEILFWCALVADVYFFVRLYRNRTDEIQRIGEDNYTHKFRIFVYMGASFVLQEISEIYLMFSTAPEHYVIASLYLLLSACFFCGCYHLISLRIPQTQESAKNFSFTDFSESTNNEKSLQNNLSDKGLEIFERLEDLMVKEHLFKTPSLKCEDVARHLATNRTYLAEVLKTQCGYTFSDYVARYRIQYAESYMTLYPAAPVQKIAEASGFASVETFWRTYKKVTGHTPKANKRRK